MTSKAIEAVKPLETGIPSLSGSGAQGAGGDAGDAGDTGDAGKGDGDGDETLELGSGEGLVYPNGKPYVRPTEEEFRKAGYKQSYTGYFARMEADLADKMREASEKPAKSAREPTEPNEERSLFHVVGPGSVFFGGQTHAPRAALQLTEDEADDLGDAVKPGKPPATKAQVATRKAGSYKVAGPGNVCHEGKFHGPGTVLELSQVDAVSLGDAVEHVK